MNMQTSKSFVQSQNMTSLSLICQKIWLSTQMIISTNLFRKKDLQERILVENPVPLNLQSLRKMDAFMRDLIFEKKGGSRLKFSQAATKITRCYGTFI